MHSKCDGLPAALLHLHPGVVFNDHNLPCEFEPPAMVATEAAELVVWEFRKHGMICIIQALFLVEDTKPNAAEFSSKPILMYEIIA